MEQKSSDIDELLERLGTSRDNVKVAMRFDSRKDDAWQSVKGKSMQKVVATSKLRMLMRVAAIFVPLIALGLLWQLNVQSPDEYVYVTSAERDTVELIDGTMVIMNSNSKLVYQQYGTKRVAEVSGMAYFDVMRDEQKPFIVESGDAEVTVLGTAFTVENVEGRERICVIVNEGKVRFDVGEHSVQLVANDIATWTEDGHLSIGCKAKDDDSSWTACKMKLNDASLDDVVGKLLVHYTEIKGVKNKVVADTTRVTTVFDNQSLSSVLEELTIHFGKKIELDNGYLVISN